MVSGSAKTSTSPSRLLSGAPEARFAASAACLRCLAFDPFLVTHACPDELWRKLPQKHRLPHRRYCWIFRSITLRTWS